MSVDISTLRRLLKTFNEDLGVYINNEERYKLGRVLTIIDATTPDPEQRKAVKDLIQNEWWNNNVRPSQGMMSNPHTDIRALCRALGFELYEPTGEMAIPEIDTIDEFTVKRYEKLVKE